MRLPPIDQLGNALRWLPAWGWQQLFRRRIRGASHLLIAIADRFEPSTVPSSQGRFAPRDEQDRRLERWCREYPSATGGSRDADRYPLRNISFFPAEQYDPILIGRLAQHCRDGWGEFEIHLHHGVDSPYAPGHTESTVIFLRDSLEKEGRLSRWLGQGPARYAFLHGIWPLANSAGRFGDHRLKLVVPNGLGARLTAPATASSRLPEEAMRRDGSRGPV